VHLCSTTYYLKVSHLFLTAQMCGRPSARPAVTAISGIRSSFCFRVAGESVLAVRELSCRCVCCLEHRWTDCSNTDAGDWKYVTMTKVAASVGASTRSQRSEVSSQRRTLAQGISPAEIIAMETADDLEGFSFWLARAEGPAFQYDGPRVCEAGRLLILVDGISRFVISIDSHHFSFYFQTQS